MGRRSDRRRRRPVGVDGISYHVGDTAAGSDYNRLPAASAGSPSSKGSQLKLMIIRSTPTPFNATRLS